MAGDMQRVLTEKKPTLLARPPRPRERLGATASDRWTEQKFKVTAMALLGVIALLITAWFWRSELPALVENLPQPVPPPGSAFFFNATETLLLSSSSPPLPALLAGRIAIPRAPGSFTRLLIEVERLRADPAALSARGFFDAIGIEPPPQFLDAIEPLPQWFIYGGADGRDAGIIFVVKNGPAAAEALAAWEPTIRSDFAFMIPTAPPPPPLIATTTPDAATGTTSDERALLPPAAPSADPVPPRFKSQSYRNIEFRFRELISGHDQGWGYLYFPARRRIIMGTSTAALRAAIDRLFESPNP